MKQIFLKNLRELTQSLIRQEPQRPKSKKYDNKNANKAGILAWTPKNDQIPPDPPAMKPNRPKSVAEGNPIKPSDESSKSSNTTRSSEK